MACGVKGYLHKDNAIAELLDCINAVKNGGFYISKNVKNALKSNEADLLAAQQKNSEAEEIRQILILDKTYDNNPRFITEQYRKIAHLFSEKNRMDSALYYAQKAHQNGEKVHSL